MFMNTYLALFGERLSLLVTFYSHIVSFLRLRLPRRRRFCHCRAVVGSFLPPSMPFAPLNTRRIVLGMVSTLVDISDRRRMMICAHTCADVSLPAQTATRLFLARFCVSKIKHKIKWQRQIKVTTTDHH